jgi:predicted sulfurtransferase
MIYLGADKLGFLDVYNLTGGITEYASSVDPSILMGSEE